jgi:hypothetical protein
LSYLSAPHVPFTAVSKAKAVTAGGERLKAFRWKVKEEPACQPFVLIPTGTGVEHRMLSQLKYVYMFTFAVHHSEYPSGVPSIISQTSRPHRHLIIDKATS